MQLVDENGPEIQLACACDLANSWARELGVKECENPYSGLELRNLIDRLWNKCSQEKNRAIR